METNPNSIIIECSNLDARRKDPLQENSEWTTQIQYPLSLDDGDSLSINKVFIDSQQGDVILTEPVSLGFNIGFYDNNSGTLPRRYENGCTNDSEYYQAWFIDSNSSGNLQTFNIIQIPGTGDYDWEKLYVDFQYWALSTVPPGWREWESNSFKWSSTQNVLTMNPSTAGSGGDGPFMNPIGISEGLILVKFRSGDPDHDPGDPNNYFKIDPASLVYNGIVIQTQEYTKSFNLTIPAGTYTRDSLAKTLTQTFVDIGSLSGGTDVNSISPFMIRADDAQFVNGGNINLRWYKFGDSPQDVPAKPYYVFETPAPISNPAPVWCGASQIAIVYDQDSSQYQFQFYTPQPGTAANPASPGAIINRVPNQAGGILRIVPDQTGIYFWDLQSNPPNFWENTLGFNLDNQLIVSHDGKSSSNHDVVSLEQFLLKTTRALVGVSALVPNFDRDWTGNYPIYLESSAVKTINSRDVDDGDTLFYLIEVNIGSESFIYGNQGLNHWIRAIVSNYNTSENIITGYSSDGLLYVHSGTSQFITQISIRILDPITKRPVESLGLSNFVYLQLNKAIKQK